MLRKVFLKDGVVVAHSLVGSIESDVTFKKSDTSVFVTDDEIEIDVGYTFDGTVYTKPPVVPVVAGVPVFVEMKQARLALSEDGHLATVNTAMLTMTEAEQIEWEFAPTVRRNDPLVAKIALLIPLNDAQVDALFIKASTK